MGSGSRARIRPATPADVAAMQAIEREAPTAAHWSDSQYRQLFDTSTERTALVIEDSAVRGFLIGRALGDEWELENIAIAAAVRRRGLGSALIRHFVELAQGQDVSGIFLEVRESNQSARAVYEKLGFVQSGRRKRYYEHPLEDAITYRLVFSP